MMLKALLGRARQQEEVARPMVLGVAPSPMLVFAPAESTKGPALGDVLSKAASRALPSGVAGGVAMGLNILCLMWLRTTINYQYRYGTGTLSAIGALYKDGGGGLGGVTRFYRGLVPALMQGPLSRFGDTAANTGTLVILDAYPMTKDLPAFAKTAFCSITAASWRLFLMPIDTWKTTMQTDGAKGMGLLWNKIKQKGPIVLYNGGYGAILANIVGYYPWFATYNTLEDVLPKKDSDGNDLTGVKKLGRRALMGFGASAVSDTTSNSIRVVKVYKQTHPDPTITYVQCAQEVVAKDGVMGLLGRGLGTKLISNGIQGAMFSVLWKTIEPMLFPKDK
mmetsp:Transcript_4163/g.16821  ORF Transcript_4163/g.16821 Transcript_4163/m.16821 type:complete len:336 (-) Transcript_4163:759-1766(-)